VIAFNLGAVFRDGTASSPRLGIRRRSPGGPPLPRCARVPRLPSPAAPNDRGHVGWASHRSCPFRRGNARSYVHLEGHLPPAGREVRSRRRPDPRQRSTFLCPSSAPGGRISGKTLSRRGPGLRHALVNGPDGRQTLTRGFCYPRRRALRRHFRGRGRRFEASVGTRARRDPRESRC
jgi:hypothetical protein